MIRKLQKTDVIKVADIWLDSNIKAHDFIPTQYWKSNFELPESVKLIFPLYQFHGFRINIKGRHTPWSSCTKAQSGFQSPVRRCGDIWDFGNFRTFLYNNDGSISDNR